MSNVWPLRKYFTNQNGHLLRVKQTGNLTNNNNNSYVKCACVLEKSKNFLLKVSPVYYSKNIFALPSI